MKSLIDDPVSDELGSPRRVSELPSIPKSEDTRSLKSSVSVIGRFGMVFTIVCLSLSQPFGASRSQAAYDSVGAAALAVTVYDASKAQCEYNDAIAEALKQIDAFMVKSQGDRYEEVKQGMPAMLPSIRNQGRYLGSSACNVYATVIGYAIPIYYTAIDNDPAVIAGLEKFFSDREKSKAEDAKAFARMQDCNPKSAPGIMLRYNREHGIPSPGPDCPSDAPNPEQTRQASSSPPVGNQVQGVQTSPSKKTSLLPKFPEKTPYGEARRLLTALGYQGFKMSDADKCDSGDSRCFPEIESCAGAGEGDCNYTWKKGEKIIQVGTVSERPQIVNQIRCLVNCDD